MKKTLVVLMAALVSIPAFASSTVIEEFVNSNGETSAKVTEPRFPGSDLPLRFDDWNKENGVCVLLGYERAVPHSTIFGGREQRLIMVDANGQIERMRGDFNRVTEIVCLNKVSYSPSVKLNVVINPVHADSGFPVRFDDWNKENGVCIMQGFDRAVPSSTVFGGTEQRVIMLDATGQIERMRGDFNRVAEIVCIENI